MKIFNAMKPGLFCLLLLLFALAGFSQTNNGNKKPLVVFVTGDHEYGGESTLPFIAAELEKNYGFRTKVLKAFPDQNAEENIPGLEALKEAGAHVKGMVAIFTYGFDVAVENFKKANVDLNTLADYNHLLALAVAKNYITEKELITLQEWRESPSTWSV
jgi:hypothetical protein